MSLPAIQLLSEEEYLAIERVADYKSEFVNGEMFAMAGGLEPHNLVASNVNRELGNALKSLPCRVYTSDMRVKIPATGLYTYPDVTVVCGSPEFADDRRDVIVNPVVLVEVLSDSTEAYDRGGKFEHYQRLESLREYLLVAQDRPRIERFFRQQPGDEWSYALVSGLDAVLHLASLDCDLRLEEVYDKVDFPPAPEPPPLLKEPVGVQRRHPRAAR